MKYPKIRIKEGGEEGRKKGGEEAEKTKENKKWKKREIGNAYNIFKLQGNKTNLGNTYRIIEIYESFVSYLLLYIKLLLKLSSLKQ